MKKLVRYHPLIGSPAWMSYDRAKDLLRQEDRLYVDMRRAGMQPPVPRIEFPQERKR